MAHHKRKGRAKKNSKAVCFCKWYRWEGNGKKRFGPREQRQREEVAGGKVA